MASGLGDSTDDHQKLPALEDRSHVEEGLPPVTDDKTDGSDLAAMHSADPTDVEYVFAQTARRGGWTSTRAASPRGVSATTLWFSDRPERSIGARSHR